MILCDLDGVLVDFPTSAAKLFNKKIKLKPGQHTHDALGTSKNQLWKAINKAGMDFWANAELYHWADTFYNKLTRLDEVVITTAPSYDPQSSSGKVKFLQEFFDDRSFRDYVITKRKELLAGPDRILIDDKEANIAKFIEYGGIGILFPQPWNKLANLASDPISYVMKELKMCYPASRFEDLEYASSYDWLQED